MGQSSSHQKLLDDLKRDYVWALLWNFPQAGWVNSTILYHRHTSQLSAFIATQEMYIGRDKFTRHLDKLVEQGRARKRRVIGHHPQYQVIQPEI